MVSVFFMLRRCRQFHLLARKERRELIGALMSGSTEGRGLPPALLTAVEQQRQAVPSSDWAREVEKIVGRYYLQNANTVPVYCNTDLAIPGNHVNNAKYSELVEYVRYYNFSLTNLYSDSIQTRVAHWVLPPLLARWWYPSPSSPDYPPEEALNDRIMFVVSDTSVEFIQEIKPFAEVQCSCVFMASEDPLRMSMLYTIFSPKENSDRVTLHSTVVVTGVFLTDANTQQALQRVYSPDASSLSSPSTTTATMVKAPTDQVLANAMKLTDTTEVREILQRNRRKWIGGREVQRRHRCWHGSTRVPCPLPLPRQNPLVTGWRHWWPQDTRGENH